MPTKNLAERIGVVETRVENLNEKLDELKNQHSSDVLLCVQTDVSQPADCKNFIEKAIHQFGGIDILINNAGISMKAEMVDCDAAVIKKVMDVNFNGALYCTTYALPYLIKSKGVIVGISSIAGYRGLPGRSGYSASKFALQGFLEAIKTELIETFDILWCDVKCHICYLFQPK